MTQIEAKALEEFPPDFGYEAIDGEVMEVDVNEPLRAAFIKGCQYAATPSAVSREDAEKWIQSEYPIQVDEVHFKNGNYINMDIHAPIREGMYRLYDYLASLSPAQPGYSEWISVEEGLPEPTLEVVLLIDHFCETKNYYEVTKWDGGQINSWRVTHWMPLPSPPLNLKP